MEKLPAEVAQGNGEEKPVEATASDDEDRAAAMSSESAAKEEPTMPIEAQDATETKPLLAAEQDPTPPVQGGFQCLPGQHSLQGSCVGDHSSLDVTRMMQGLCWR